MGCVLLFSIGLDKLLCTYYSLDYSPKNKSLFIYYGILLKLKLKEDVVLLFIDCSPRI
jgi:hypothetical protein